MRCRWNVDDMSMDCCWRDSGVLVALSRGSPHGLLAIIIYKRLRLYESYIFELRIKT